MKLHHVWVVPVLGLLACLESTSGPPEEDLAAEPAAAALVPDTLRPDVPEKELAALRAREGERSARALAEVERRFAVRSPGLSFRVRRVRTNSMGDTHVWIQQVFRGTPVEGRDLGVILFVDDALQVIGEPDRFEGVASARLTATARLERARAHARAKGLFVLGDGEEVLEPVYERFLRPGARGDNAADYETRVVRFERGQRVKLAPAPVTERAPRELFVRERDGAVLERGLPRPAGMQLARLRSAYAGTVYGLATYQDTSGVYYLQSEGGDQVFAAAQPRRGSFAYTNVFGNDWGDNRLFAHGNVAMTNGQTAAADAFISIQGVNRMFRNVYGQNGWNGSGGPLYAYVHLREANAYAIGNGVMSLGYLPPWLEGGDLPSLPLTDIETVGHEVGHMAYEEMTGVVGYEPLGELGGLDEGTADIFGLIAGFYLPDALTRDAECPAADCGRRPITVRNDWTFANWITDGEHSRSFIDPLIPAWEPSIVQAQAHHASGPLVRMFYFLSVGVLSRGQPQGTGLLSPQRPSPFLPNGMAGLGIDTANWIWYQTLSGFYFSRITGYHTAREMMLEATANTYGRKLHTPQYKAVEDAWAAVNVGPPADRKAPTVVVTTVQKSATEATVTVEVSDDNGVLEGTVVISSGLIGGPSSLELCTSRCVYTINPQQYGNHPKHFVRVTAKDTRENEVTRTVYFSLDLAPPVVSITTNKGPGWPAISPLQDWKYTGSDPSGIASARVFIDGVPILQQTWSNPATPSFTFDSVPVNLLDAPEGFYRVRFETADIHGSTQTTTHILITDRTPPEQCDLSVTVDPANNGNVYLRLVGSDSLSGIGLLALHYSGGPLRTDGTKAAGGIQRTLNHTVTLPPGTYSFWAYCDDQRINETRTPTQTITVLGKCNTMAVAGGPNPDERTFSMGKPSGTVSLRFHTFTVHDRIKVFSGTTLVADTGCVSTGDPSYPGTRTFSYSGTTGLLKVRVEPNCNPVTAAPTTEWNYSLSCPP